MDWWARFKRRVFDSGTKTADEKSGPPPLCILAKCAAGELLPREVAISEVRPDGATFKCRAEIKAGARVTLRIPDLTAPDPLNDFVPIKCVVLETRLADAAASEYESEVRFTETTNPGRDRWVGRVLGSHGIRLADTLTPSERRGGGRYTTSLPVRVRVDSSLVSGYVRNISLGGMLALVDGEVTRDTLAIFELQMPATRHLLKLPGRIVHAEPGNEDAFSIIGVAFEALPSEQEQALTSGLEAIARQAGRKKRI